MKYYAAPLEGMTNYMWRRIHADIFGGADRYFTPFVSPNATCKFQTKESDELRHNEGLPVIPQILTNSAEHFLWAAREMAEGGVRCGRTDLALATTGIAGPGGGTPEKPVGLVYIAVSDGTRTEVRKLNLAGDRLAVRTQAAEAVLALLYETFLSEQ